MKSILKNLRGRILRMLMQNQRVPRSPKFQVCIFKTDRLGDFILSLQAIRLIAQRFGEENVVLAVSSYSKDLARSEFPGIRQVVLDIDPSSILGTIWNLRKNLLNSIFWKGAKNCVVLRHHRSFVEDLIVAAIPCNNRIGYQRSELVDYRSDPIAERPIYSLSPGKTQVAKGGLPKELSITKEIVQIATGVHFTDKEILPILPKRSEVRNVVGISPFASSKLRDIPIGHLNEICKIAFQKGYEVELWAPAGAEQRYFDLSHQLMEHNSGKIPVRSIRDSVELILAAASSYAVVSAETGTAHIATALDKPTLIFIGGGHFGWFGPWYRSDRQVWLNYSTPCSSCKWVCSKSGPICITEIPTHDVVSALGSILPNSSETVTNLI